MGTIEIVYSQLDDVSKYATKVAEKCEDYYEKLNTKCLDTFSDLVDSPLGEKNSRTSMAYYYVEQKRKKLDKKKDRFAQFAKDVITFKEDTKEADHRVAKSVNDSQKKFYEQHKNLKGDGWAAFFATVSVDHPVIGYFISKVKSKISTLNSLQNALRHWYEIDGGKKVIDTVLSIATVAVEALGLVVAVCAIISGGIGIVAIAALVGAVIGVVDSIVNLSYQLKANGQKDPAWAKYYGGIDDGATALRKTTYKTKLGNEASMKLALGLDITSTVCSVIDLVDGAKKLYKGSGLNKLFDTVVEPSENGKKIYKFDFSKAKSVLTSSDGRASVKKTLKQNWKRIVFGHDAGNTTQNWKRAFFSKDPELPMKYRNISDYSVLSAENIKEIKRFHRTNKANRVGKITGVFKDGISKGKTGVKIFESGVKLIGEGEFSIHDQIDNISDYTHKSGGSIQYTDDVFHFVEDMIG